MANSICVICLGENSDFEARCGHHFHQECHPKMFRQQITCPCCRIKISSNKNLEYAIRYYKGEEEILKELSTTDLREILRHFCDKKMENFEPIISTLMKRSWKLEQLNAYNMETLMTMACEAGHLPMVHHLIKLGVDINKVDNYSCKSPIHCAVEKENLDLLNVLIENGADLTKEGCFRGTPLSFACANANLPAVERLMEFNLVVKESGQSIPALYALAASSQGNHINHIPIAKLLLSKGAVVNTRDRNLCTPLHFAAANGSTEFVDFIIKNGADVNATNKFGYTPLMKAVAKGEQLQVMKKLIDHGANIEVKGGDEGFNALHSACASGNLEMVNYLIEKGIDINSRVDYDGITGLHVALLTANYEIAMMLLERGCRVDLRTPMNLTPLHALCFSAKGKNPDLHSKIVSRLLQSGCSVNARGGWYQETPLAMLCKGKPSMELLSFLVDKGAYINAGDYFDQTPLHHAVFDCNVKLVEILIKLGADVKAKDSYGRQPVHQILIGNRKKNAYSTARSSGALKDYPKSYFKILEMLKSAGADLNAQTNRGAAAIHYIKSSLDWGFIEKFAELGADLLITDHKGRDLFLRAKKRDILESLKWRVYRNIRKSLKERKKLKKIRSNVDHQIYQFLCVNDENKS